MIYKVVFQWLRQRPWLLTPFLALIPLAGVYLNQRYSSQAQNAPTSISTPATASPVATASPLPTPPPFISASQSPTAKPSPTPVDPKKYTKEQAAINEKSKAAFAAAVGTVDSLIEMQVAIVMGANSIQIGGSQGATILDQTGRSLSTLGRGTSYTLQAAGDGFTLDAQALPASIMIQPKQFMPFDRDLRDIDSVFDIVYAAHQILRYAEGITLEILVTDDEKQAAILYRIVVIGEATKRISQQFRDQHSEIPWQKNGGNAKCDRPRV